MRAVITLVLLLCTVCFVSGQACKYADLNTYVADFTAKANALNNPYAFFNTSAVAALGDLATTATQACFNDANTLITGMNTVPANITTDQCFASPGTPEFNNDPCCSFGNAQTSCCAPRIQQYTNMVVAGFSTTAAAKCGSQQKVFQMLRNFISSYQADQMQCSQVFQQRTKFLGVVATKLFTCLTNFIQEGATKTCTKNSDCFSNQCNTDIKRCQPTAGELDPANTAFARCIITSLPTPVARTIAAGSFGIAGPVESNPALLNQFSTALQNAVASDVCLDTNTFQVQTAFTSSATCLAQKKCTDSTNTTCDTTKPASFCGSACDPVSKICAYDVSAMFPSLYPNEASCAIGNCYTDSSVVFNVNKTECNSQSFCFGNSQLTSQSTCENAGVCLGFPYPPNGATTTCVVPPTIDNGYAFCPTSATLTITQTDLGCVVHGLTNSQCTANNGTVINVPTTQQQCENFVRCYNTDVGSYDLKSAAECTKCEQNNQQLFQWRSNSWLPRLYMPSGFWTKREEKPMYKWTKVLNYDKFTELVNIAMGLQYGPLLSGFMLCSYGPFNEVFKRYACACGTDKLANTDTCFADSIENTQASIIAFPALAQTFRLAGGITLEVTNTSVSVQDGASFSIDLKKSPNLDKQPTGATTTRRALDQQAASALAIKNAKGEVIGQVMGDGFRLNKALRSPATLCLKKDPAVRLQNSKHTKNAMAMKKNGAYVLAPAELKTSNDATVCASIGDTEMYFPSNIDPSVPVGPAPTPADSSKKNPSAAARSLGSLVLAVAVATASLALAIMF